MSGRPTALPVSRADVLRRGLLHTCPNCGSRSLFGPGWRWVSMQKACRVCGLKFERGEGFFLGAMVISYTFTGLMLVPVLILVIAGTLDVAQAVAAMVTWCIAFPLAFYRTSKSLWLMTWYFAVPGDLPANGGGTEPR